MEQDKHLIEFIILSNLSFLWAHQRDSGEGAGETLEAHTKLVDRYFARMTADLRFENICDQLWNDFLNIGCNMDYRSIFWEMIYNIPHFHDTGKANPAYQNIKMQNPKYEGRDFVDGMRGSEHSFLSSLIYLDYYLGDIKKRCQDTQSVALLRHVALIGAYVISRHHSDLCSLADYVERFRDRNGEVRYLFLESKSLQEIYPCVRYFSNKARISNVAKGWEKTTRTIPNYLNIRLMIFVRLMYSLLVASDFCNE